LLSGEGKKDLSANHIWVGYCHEFSKFTSNGVYAYIRHPIYTGIYIFVLGSFFTIIPHINFASYITLGTAAIISTIYMIGFLAFLANKETTELVEKHGLPFQQYKEKVHPFLPLRKYITSTCK
jgi:protein-S-isoprenylcysteine O-methyltransferase Ste14